MLKLAKDSVKIEAYCHVSTAYVNCNQPLNTIIEEKIYNPINVDQDIEKLMAMSPEYAKENLSAILNGYPNTYTFTKSMFERSMQHHRGNLPACIIRPSMIGCSLKEPYVGWVDSISAIGAPCFISGLGLFNYQVGNGSEIIDVVAVDQVCNSILLASTNCSTDKSQLHIYNHTSSLANPFCARQLQDSLNHFNQFYPYDKQVMKPYLMFVSRLTRSIKLKLFHEIPYQLLNLFARLPIVGSAKLENESS